MSIFLYGLFFLFTGNDGLILFFNAGFISVPLYNTIKIIVFTSLSVVVVASICAWVNTVVAYPLRKLADFMLVLPIVLPVFSTIYAYELVFNTFELPRWFEFHSVAGSCLVYFINLFPYAYMLLRANFSTQNRRFYELSTTSGVGPFASFMQTIIPLARRSIFAACILVGFEIFSDYTVAILLKTPTLGSLLLQTFTSKQNYHDIGIQLAVTVVIFIGIVVIFELLLRRQKQYHQLIAGHQKFLPQPVSTQKSLAAFALNSVIIIVLLVVPLVALLSNSLQNMPASTIWLQQSIINSTILTTIAASIIIVIALLFFIHIQQQGKRNSLTWQWNVTAMAMVLPTTLLATLGLFTIDTIEPELYAWYRALGLSPAIISLAIVVVITFIALTVKFLALVLYPLASIIESIGLDMEQAAQTLGSNQRRLFVDLFLPTHVRLLLAICCIIWIKIFTEISIQAALPGAFFPLLTPQVFEKILESGIQSTIREQLAMIGVSTVFVTILYFLIPKKHGLFS